MRCIQAPGNPVIYKVQGGQRVGYRSWPEYEADGKPPVEIVSAAELEHYELVDYFAEEFEHIGKASTARMLMTRWAIPEFPSRNELLACSLANCHGELYLEFGALTGKTLNVIASQVDGLVYGFDSFEGLPENWGPGFRKGHFKTSHRLPTVASNARLVVGWFEDSLIPFLANHPGQVAFAHIDSDVYSSAKYVLATLAEAGRLGEGTVLQFDEIFAIKGDLWYRSEYDAFREFIQARRVRYEWLGRADEAAALRIIP